ncbi:HAD family hydrolase [Nanoarchaeota archaeon]
MPKNYIFDLFGTLVNQDDSHMTLLKEFFGVSKDIYKKAIRIVINRNNYVDIKEGFDDLCKLTGKNPDYMDFKLTLDRYKRESCYVFEDAFYVLETLKERGSKLGLISNQAVFYEDVIKTTKLNTMFDVIVLSQKVGLLKPEIPIYGLARKDMNVPLDTITMVGDNIVKDVETPIQIGMKAILIDHYNKHPEYSPRITSLSELLSI